MSFDTLSHLTKNRTDSLVAFDSPGFRKSENIKDSIETSRRALERTFGIEVAA